MATITWKARWEGYASLYLLPTIRLCTGLMQRDRRCFHLMLTWLRFDIGCYGRWGDDVR